MNFDPNKDYYGILGVTPTAELAVIKAAYKALAAIYHTERNSTKEAVTKMQAINEAWEILSDPSTRKKYDEAIGDKKPESDAFDETDQSEDEDDDLIIYRDVYLKNGKPKRLGEPVLQLVEERFARIKVTSHRSKEHLIPDFMQVKNKGDKRMEDGDDQWYRQRDSELRSLRRSLDQAKKTLKSVQEGKFPN